MYSLCTARTRLRSVAPPSPDVCSTRAPQEVDIGVVRVGESRIIDGREDGSLGDLSRATIHSLLLIRVGVVQAEHSSVLSCALRDRDRRLPDSQQGGLSIPLLFVTSSPYEGIVTNGGRVNGNAAGSKSSMMRNRWCGTVLQEAATSAP